MQLTSWYLQDGLFAILAKEKMWSPHCCAYHPRLACALHAAAAISSTMIYRTQIRGASTRRGDADSRQVAFTSPPTDQAPIVWSASSDVLKSQESTSISCCTQHAIITTDLHRCGQHRVVNRCMESTGGAFRAKQSSRSSSTLHDVPASSAKTQPCAYQSDGLASFLLTSVKGRANRRGSLYTQLQATRELMIGC